MGSLQMPVPQISVFFRLLPQGASHTNRRNNLVVSEIVRIFADENEMKDK